MQYKGSEFTNKMIGGAPDLDMSVVRSSDVLAIRREFDGLDRFVKIAVMKDDASAEIDKQCTAVCTPRTVRCKDRTCVTDER